MLFLTNSLMNYQQKVHTLFLPAKSKSNVSVRPAALILIKESLKHSKIITFNCLYFK